VPPKHNRAVFLDRDGVITRSLIIGGKPIAPRSLSEFEIFPEVAAPLRLLKDAGFWLVVVTNQPDVGKGLVPREVVEEMHRQLQEALPLDAIKVSYGTTDADPMRKPNPGMLKEAATDRGIDLTASYMVGDRWRDIDAGRAAGCQTILVGDGYGEVPQIHFDHNCLDLAEAVNLILNRNNLI
jgi:D-glycero-D-manno-heptose 1,7-bisphosphate phosphatase